MLLFSWNKSKEKRQKQVNKRKKIRKEKKLERDREENVKKGEAKKAEDTDK